MNAQVTSNIEKHQLPDNSAKNLLGKSFNIYKLQVQGASLSTWCVARRELDFQVPKPTKASQDRQN